MSDILSTLLAGDGFDLPTGANDAQWGIFLNGQSVVEAEQVISFGYKQDWPLSTYQVEEGGFETYDKVQLPFEASVQFGTGGDQPARQALLDSIDAIAGDLNLYDVVTPEKTYLSCNVTHYDYDRRSDAGVGFIRITVHLLEVRVTAAAQFSTSTPITSAKNPTANDQINNGTTQTSVPSSAPNIGTAAILPANFTSMVQ